MKINILTSNIRFDIEFTFIKIMAFLILIMGSLYSLITKEGTVITLAIVTSAGLLGYRKFEETAQKKVDLEAKKINRKVETD